MKYLIGDSCLMFSLQERGRTKQTRKAATKFPNCKGRKVSGEDSPSQSRFLEKIHLLNLFTGCQSSGTSKVIKVMCRKMSVLSEVISMSAVNC